MKNDPITGAVLLGEELSLPEIWLSLHRSATEWLRVGGTADTEWRREQITASDQNLLRLLDDLTFEHWNTLCGACGMTTSSLLAAGWTSGADMPLIAQKWGAAYQETTQPFIAYPLFY